MVVRGGVVVPADFTRDRELWRWAPEELSLLVTRLDPVPMDDNLTMAAALNEPRLLDRPVRQVVAGGAAAVLFACTTCSFVGGREREQSIEAVMRTAGARPALTTAASLVRAVRAVGGTRAAVVHPYDRPVGARLRSYLDAAGVAVVRSSRLEVGLTEVSTVETAHVVDAVRRGDDDRADVVVVSCTELPAYDAIGTLEAELGKPVVSADQAGMWALCRALGVAAAGPGQSLVDRHGAGFLRDEV